MVGGQIQASTVEQNGVDEVLLVAESARGVLHPLNLGVDRFTAGVSDTMLEIGDDVGEPAHKHSGYFFHGLETASYGPSIPEVEVLQGRTLVTALEESHAHFFQGPSAGRDPHSSRYRLSLRYLRPDSSTAAASPVFPDDFVSRHYFD
jgi:hypothetical protein